MFSCVAVPKMIQYYLEIGYLFGVLKETYWRMFHPMTVPVGAGAVLFVLVNLQYRFLIEFLHNKFF